MKYPYIALVISFNLSAMDLDYENNIHVGTYKSEEENESVYETTSESLSDIESDNESKTIVKPSLNWNQFLQNILNEAMVRDIHEVKKQNILITYNGQTTTPLIANQCALEHIAKLSFSDSLEHFNKTLSPEDGGYLFQHKGIQSDPYILFIYLSPDIQKKVLEHLELKSKAAQNKFLAMPVSKAFTYYAACKEHLRKLSFDLYYLLNTRAQVKYMERILYDKNTSFTKKEPLNFPIYLLEEPAYKEIMSKKITIYEEVPWRNSVMVKQHKTTIKDIHTPHKHIAPIGKDSPTILSRVKSLFRSGDYTSQPFHHE